MESETITYIAAVESAMGSFVPLDKVNAIDDFIVKEKAAGRWSLHKYIWLPVWANVYANVICLKTGITVGSYPNGATHSAGYVLGNGSTQYFNSERSSSTYLNVSSTHVFALTLESPPTGTLYGVGQGKFEVFQTETSGLIYQLSGIMGNTFNVNQTETSGLIYQLSGIMGNTFNVNQTETSGLIYQLSGIMGNTFNVNQTETSGLIYQLSGIMGNLINNPLNENTGVVWDVYGTLI